MSELVADSKFIILVRHGELDNPKNIVYNLDRVMEPEDIMHLSKLGVSQMRNLGEIIKQKGFNVKRILRSPETRVKESIEALNEQLGIEDVKEDVRLDDVYAPGPYKLGITMDEWALRKGNCYEGPEWEGYNHEKPVQMRDRMRECFDEAARSLSIGETVILISHGDSLSWLLNDLITGSIPKPDKLRDSIYPEKGVGIVIVLSERNKVLSHYQINAQDAGSKY